MEKALRERTTAEVHFDPIHRRAYSVDASIYEIEPVGVAIPKTVEDVIEIVKIAKEHGIPVIPRGAATGITGGCIGKGLIIDTSKYLNRILEINYDKEYAICQPGVIQDDLNRALSSKGYRLGPDTSTGDRATLGGMAANNAAGARSLRYGKMVDHVEAVDLVIASGELIHFEKIDGHELEKKRLQNTSEGQIYREVIRIKDAYGEEIKNRFPKLPRRASGYNLDELVKDQPLNLAKLIAGSEGTLGILTSIKVRLARKPVFLGLCVVHFHSMHEGMKTIETMLEHNPLSLEMIDDKIIEMGRRSPVMKNKLDWLSGAPRMVFVAEFDGASQDEVGAKLMRFEREMEQQGIGYSRVSLKDPQAMSCVWEIRKAGLGLLLSKRSYSRAIAFIEDVSVPPKNLPDFMDKFEDYLRRTGKEAGIYGHVGPGCMHVRPYIDLRKKEELHLLKKMMEDVTDLLIEHNGTLSGEHGDGIIRAWLNPKLFGEKIYRAFQELKRAFDPLNLMNPGKIVDGQPVLDNLRIDPDTPSVKITTFLDFTREGGFDLAADLCNGNGLCRKKTGVMCPSFQATGDEYDSTRSRAQALRAVIHGKLPIETWTGSDLYDVLDLCIQCKGCKTECPSQVDMAKMKSEFLYHYQEKHGYSLRTRLIGHLGTLYALGSKFPRFSNFMLNIPFSKWLLEKIGFSPKRSLPSLASQRFSHWFSSFAQPEPIKGQVVLFNDTYTEFICPEIGKAAVKVLNAIGYSVILPAWNCCGRPLISKGMLKDARKKAQALIHALSPYIEQGLPIIGLEPSCILSLKDEFIDLIQENKSAAEKLRRLSVTFDEFIFSQLMDGKLPFPCQDQPKTVYVHGHCHQKSLVGMRPTLNVLKAIPNLEVVEIPSGCCGMAGSFGYEKEHADFSLSIGELQLFPAIRSAPENAAFMADGFSCRSQIFQGTQQKSYHLAEILAKILN